jgi:hypothetical protein
MVIVDQIFFGFKLVLEFFWYNNILGLLCEELLFGGSQLVLQLDDDFLGFGRLSLNKLI